MNQSKLDPNTGSEIEWDHPFIRETGLAPGELVREMLGYSPSHWQNRWLKQHAGAVLFFNRKPWINLKALREVAAADPEDSAPPPR